MALISDRDKGKSTAQFICDECSSVFKGNYYVLTKKYTFVQELFV
jgi:hypothetical protein